MNIYRHRFCAKCPNNQRTITYNLEIESEHTIMVEEIVQAGQDAGTIEQPYHENIADMMHKRFEGKQRLRAFHHGVEIETHRG